MTLINKPDLNFFRTCRLLIMPGLMIASLNVAAQNKPAKPHPQVRAVARAKKDRILLRWAVSTPAAWKLSNKYGFRIERYTVLRNNALLPAPERKLLSPEPIRPRPLPEWESIVRNNSPGHLRKGF
jgi:hypothetical protein